MHVQCELSQNKFSFSPRHHSKGENSGDNHAKCMNRLYAEFVVNQLKLILKGFGLK